MCNFYAKFGTVNDLFREYRSQQMGVVLRKIYNFYKTSGNMGNFLARYVEEFKRALYSKDNIHYQRRIVSGYYQQMSALVEKDRS